MPRSPTIATPPPGVIPQNPGDTIQSATWNVTVADIYNILNTVLPIEYGGNGVADGKPLDNSFGIRNSADTTKLAIFSATNIPVSTTLTYTLPATSGTLALTSDIAQKGYISGLTLSNNAGDAANDIDIAAGEASSDASSPILITLATGLTKRLDAGWSVGTNQGMLDTGAVANSVYYLYLIQRSDTSVVDVLASLSATSPTMPASYDRKVLIGRVSRSAGVNAVPVMYAQPPIQIAGTAPVFACRAWVSFSGTTGTIYSSGNVSSITKNATGDYTINFTQAMPDTNYAATASISASLPGSWTGAVALHASQSAQSAPTTSSMRIAVRDTGNIAIDYPYISVTVFR